MIVTLYAGSRMLEIKNLKAFYGQLQALWGINLKVDKGEFVSVIGPNGAGKSTLLKSITGLIKTKSGSINFLGEPIEKLPPHVILQKGIAMTPEGRMLFPYMTVLENLEMGAYTMKSKEKIKNRMDQVFQIFPRLKERKKQLAGTLSGGEQQMLAIGRSLMPDPKMLLFDEPSTGLAPILVSQVFAAIKRIHESTGTTILLVEQNVHHALRLADKGYIIENGKIVMEDCCEELLKDKYIKTKYMGI
jgi:branched-chain amino acid transport system ATP-binding protein